MKEITIQELAMQTVEALQGMGLAVHTVWMEYGDAYVPIVKLHTKHGKNSFDQTIVDEYLRSVDERRDCGEIGESHYLKLKRGAKRLTEMHETGKLVWSCKGRVSKFILNEYYESLLSDFLRKRHWHQNTLGDVAWVGRKFFAWLIQERHDDLNHVGAQEIQRFMIHCSNHMRGNGLYSVRLYMRMLCRYLYEVEYLPDSFAGILSFKVNRESKLLPAAKDDEVAAVLNTIDRRTSKGKRDYAIILLAVVTGLRAIDITRLKLSDIDWRNGEIKLVQSKTGKTVVLPLTKDVGEAIQDYILGGRQVTTSEEIFLRFHPPFKAFKDSVSIGDMYDDYCKRAGVCREARDGKGFHSLRRAVGKKLTTSGVPVNTTAQILGDVDINSTKKYISLDSHHLKECALDFSGIGTGVTE